MPAAIVLHLQRILSYSRDLPDILACALVSRAWATRLQCESRGDGKKLNSACEYLAASLIAADFAGVSSLAEIESAAILSENFKHVCCQELFDHIRFFRAVESKFVETKLAVDSIKSAALDMMFTCEQQMLAAAPCTPPEAAAKPDKKKQKVKPWDPRYGMKKEEESLVKACAVAWTTPFAISAERQLVELERQKVALDLQMQTICDERDERCARMAVLLTAGMPEASQIAAAKAYLLAIFGQTQVHRTNSLSDMRGNRSKEQSSLLKRPVVQPSLFSLIRMRWSSDKSAAEERAPNLLEAMNNKGYSLYRKYKCSSVFEYVKVPPQCQDWGVKSFNPLWHSKRQLRHTILKHLFLCLGTNSRKMELLHAEGVGEDRHSDDDNNFCERNDINFLTDVDAYQDMLCTILYQKDSELSSQLLSLVGGAKPLICSIEEGGSARASHGLFNFGSFWPSEGSQEQQLCVLSALIAHATAQQWTRAQIGRLLWVCTRGASMEAETAAKRAQRMDGKANTASNGLTLTDAARHVASVAGTCDAVDLMESAMNWGLTVAECNGTVRDSHGGGYSLDYCDPSIRRVHGGDY
jgi:hypothetical protein